ncbi:hypothetical protein ACVCAH_36070 [Micromonospora sp. LZ34]
MPWVWDGPSAGITGGTTNHGAFLSNAGDVEFVPVSDGGALPPAPLQDVVQLLGWRSAGSVVAATTNAAGQLSLTEMQLGAGTRRILSRFDTGSTCELGTQTCQVSDLRLATGLLPDLTVRPAGRPQRGPWPLALTIPVATVFLGTALLLGRRLRRDTGGRPRSALDRGM